MLTEAEARNGEIIEPLTWKSEELSDVVLGSRAHLKKSDFIKVYDEL